jgi:hypothetical protein
VVSSTDGSYRPVVVGPGLTHRSGDLRKEGGPLGLAAGAKAALLRCDGAGVLGQTAAAKRLEASVGLSQQRGSPSTSGKGPTVMVRARYSQQLQTQSKGERRFLAPSGREVDWYGPPPVLGQLEFW